MSRSLRAGVDSFVGGLQSATHFWSASRAPLNNDGAHPVPPLLSRPLEEIRNVIDHGPHPLLSELVGVAFHASSCHIALTFVSSASLRLWTDCLISAAPSMIGNIWHAPRYALLSSASTYLLFTA